MPQKKKARSVGFQNVIAAEGNVENLKELILQNFDKRNGKLVYISGETISIDLDQQLLSGKIYSCPGAASNGLPHLRFHPNKNLLHLVRSN